MFIQLYEALRQCYRIVITLVFYKKIKDRILEIKILNLSTHDQSNDHHLSNLLTEYFSYKKYL